MLSNEAMIETMKHIEDQQAPPDDDDNCISSSIYPDPSRLKYTPIGDCEQVRGRGIGD